MPPILDSTLADERAAYAREFALFCGTLVDLHRPLTPDEEAEFARRKQENIAHNAAFIDACQRDLPHIPWPPQDEA